MELHYRMMQRTIVVQQVHRFYMKNDSIILGVSHWKVLNYVIYLTAVSVTFLYSRYISFFIYKITQSSIQPLLYTSLDYTTIYHNRGIDLIYWSIKTFGLTIDRLVSSLYRLQWQRCHVYLPEWSLPSPGSAMWWYPALWWWLRWDPAVWWVTWIGHSTLNKPFIVGTWRYWLYRGNTD